MSNQKIAFKFFKIRFLIVFFTLSVYAEQSSQPPHNDLPVFSNIQRPKNKKLEAYLMRAESKFHDLCFNKNDLDCFDQFKTQSKAQLEADPTLQTASSKKFFFDKELVMAAICSHGELNGGRDACLVFGRRQGPDDGMVPLLGKIACDMNRNRQACGMLREWLATRKRKEGLPLLIKTCRAGSYSYCEQASEFAFIHNRIQAKELAKEGCDGNDAQSCSFLSNFFSSGEDPQLIQAWKTKACKLDPENEERDCKAVQSMKIAIWAKGSCQNGDLAECAIGCENSDWLQCTIGCEAGDMAECVTFGLHLELEGEKAKAEKLYKKACNSGQKEGMEGCRKLAINSDLNGKHDSATKLFAKACDGGSMYACINVADHSYYAGNFSEAARLYKKACDGGEVGGCNQLGDLEVKQGHVDNALNLYRIACNYDYSLSAINGCSALYEISWEQDDKNEAIRRVGQSCDSGDSSQTGFRNFLLNKWCGTGKCGYGSCSINN